MVPGLRTSWQGKDHTAFSDRRCHWAVTLCLWEMRLTVSKSLEVEYVDKEESQWRRKK